MIDPDINENGVEVQVFSTCRYCGVPISREIDAVTPSMDAWVDVTLGDACSEAVTHDTVVPHEHALLVFREDVQVTMAKRVQKGREATFLMEALDDSGRWLVNVKGQNGGLPFSMYVHPYQMEVIA